MDYNSVPSAVFEAAENKISDIVGTNVKMTRHFKERLFERFGGRLTNNIVTAVKAGVGLLRRDSHLGVTEARGVTVLPGGKTIVVPVVLHHCGEVRLKSVYRG